MKLENDKLSVSLSAEAWGNYLAKSRDEVDARGRVLGDAAELLRNQKEAEHLNARSEFIEKKLANYSKLHGVYSSTELKNSVQVDFIANKDAQRLALLDFLMRGLNLVQQEALTLLHNHQRLEKVANSSLPKLQLTYALKYLEYLKSPLSKDDVIRQYFKTQYDSKRPAGQTFFKGTMTEERIGQVCMEFISDAEQKWYPMSKLLIEAFKAELEDIAERLSFIQRKSDLDVTDKQPEDVYG
ncbi:hypothetical protein [Pseudoalteromonas luteoviolacea]|uniref:Uncharacterized protein n=1 Tax=Pseudoalteromonas luteoviolacea S4060-1 TaxID=1365257 RepID=A0A162C7B2_9GAMM|nr:hypothetical protein [Pseudoalteromonas luteoviolacea]KZN63343.1 hypothetical protein N478_03575 [Pseudoalteromonas luteoviolacea S4060-1]